MTKIPSGLLLLSLAFNAALALIFGLGARSDSSAPPDSASSTLAAAPVAPALTPEIWPGLKTDDLSALVQRARAAGFPPEMVRAMAAAQIAESFAARRKALEPPVDHLPFWKDRPPNPAADVALQRLNREQAKALHDLLGDVPDPSGLAYLTQQGGKLDFLSKEKADAVHDLILHFNEQRSDIYAAGTYATDREKLAAIDKAQRDAITRSLTPQELLDYDLRNSSTARDLRASLASLNPTEAEFRTIFPLRQAFEEKFYYSTGIPSPDQWRERNEAEKALNAQISALLPPDRAAEYDRSTNYDYRQTSQLVTRLELPADTAVDLWNTQKEFEKRRSEIYSANKAVTSSDRTQQLVALQQEAIAKVTPLLGTASHVEAYKQYGGSWLNNLAPRPAPPKN